MTLASLALTLHVISFSVYMVFPPVVLSATRLVVFVNQLPCSLGDDRLPASRTLL